MIPSQMLKGIIEGCVLAVLSQSELYGYELSEKLKVYGFGKIAEGTIYPLLLRLEKYGFITSQIRESRVGPKRKYYYITEKGREELLSFQNNFNELSKAVHALLEEVKE